jgi:hypothetical protein
MPSAVIAAAVVFASLLYWSSVAAEMHMDGTPKETVGTPRFTVRPQPSPAATPPAGTPR